MFHAALVLTAVGIGFLAWRKATTPCTKMETTGVDGVIRKVVGCEPPDAVEVQRRVEVHTANARVAAEAAARFSDVAAQTQNQIAAETTAMQQAAAAGNAEEVERLRREVERLNAAVTANTEEANRQVTAAREETARVSALAAEHERVMMELGPERDRILNLKQQHNVTLAQLRDQIRATYQQRGIAATETDALVHPQVLGYTVDGDNTIPVQRTMRVVFADTDEGQLIASTRSGTITIRNGNTTTTMSGRNSYPDVLLVSVAQRRACETVERLTIEARDTQRRIDVVLLQIAVIDARLLVIARMIGDTMVRGPSGAPASDASRKPLPANKARDVKVVEAKS